MTSARPRRWLLAAAGFGPLLLGRPESFPPAPSQPGGAPDGVKVSVLVPARDEEGSLPHLLASLARGTRRPDEVVVVDDASGDATGAIAAAAGAVVHRSSGPPPGWSGKCWALEQAQALATGDLLVFLDADVTLGRDGLARIVEAHRRLGGAGIVSAEPWHAAASASDALSSVANVAVLMGTGAFAPWRRLRSGAASPHVATMASRPMAFGPCLAVDRATYDAVGGHRAPDVRARICEDLHLARAVAAVGAPVALFTGGDAVAMRMYPEGARQAFDGWTKVLATGAGAAAPMTSAAVGLWVASGIIAAHAGGRAAAYALRGRRPVGADVATYLAWAAQLAWVQRRAGRFGVLEAVAFPVPLGWFTLASLRSALLIGLGRPLAWRGRRLTGR